MPRRIAYRIRGLDCSEEGTILRREVGGKPGVIDLEVDVLSKLPWLIRHSRRTLRYIQPNIIFPLDSSWHPLS